MPTTNTTLPGNRRVSAGGASAHAHPGSGPAPGFGLAHGPAVPPSGTPWTVNNAALPAYPAEFSPQMPFELAMQGRRGRCGQQCGKGGGYGEGALPELPC